ncbi:DinB family protein [Flavihumibacter profundi]|jgi:hypothetical protein|uniref:DinB family protein n=1 Tax=Flavihumibacter profundi TaxID=2716883 RepID=UPI001CC5B36B|nr:DinB family protein [Flavihumibacter profundi]MBZ5857310.1 DUF1569 domain-containing protein [Flavihumibacter profundi]
MKSIFDKNTREEVIYRINSLSNNSTANWGKMTVTQMVKHCAKCEEYYYGKLKVKRSILGRLIGKKVIKAILKDETSALKKNAPTSPEFEVNEDKLDFEKERAAWSQLIEGYENFDNEIFTHWFFGEMTKEQLGQFIYKHCDHHLRQFGA